MAFLISYCINAVGFLLVAMLFMYKYFTWNFDYWKKRNIKFIKPIPVLGNFGSWASLRTDIGGMFKEIYEKAKDNRIIGIWVFRKPALVIMDPDLIKTVLVKDFDHFSNRSIQTDRLNDRLGSDNLFFGKNPHWKLMRKKLTHLFSSAKIKSMFGLMDEIGNDLAECIEKFREQPLEVKEICARYTTDVIATTAFGVKANALLDANSSFNVMRKEILAFRWIRSFQFMSIFFMQGLAKFMRVQVFTEEVADWLRSVFWENVKERERTKEERKDLIAALITLKDEAQENDVIKFDSDSLVAQVGVFFTAGNETSSTTMSLLLYYLALYPDVQEKLTNEIISILEESNEDMTYDNLQKMPYLEMCFKEILRLFPPLPFLDREVTEPYQIPETNVTLAKGSYIYIPLSGIQNDERYFKNASIFKPERFDKEFGDTIAPFTYLPFGEGPRNCIGERFGMLQAKIGLVHILKKFRVEKCSKTQDPIVWQALSLSPTAKDGIYLKFVKRM